MKRKFLNKYKIGANRLPRWDYGSNAAYFITLITKNRIRYFGKITDQKMEISEVGNIANRLWFEILNHSHSIELGAFVVMPDHIHGVLIIGSYKSAVTRIVRQSGYEFAWQSNYYDHIIRDEKSFKRIERYINDKFINWKG